MEYFECAKGVLKVMNVLKLHFSNVLKLHSEPLSLAPDAHQQFLTEPVNLVPTWADRDLRSPEAGQRPSRS